MQIKKSIVLVAIILVVTAVVYYQYAAKLFQGGKGEINPVKNDAITATKENVESTTPAPNAAERIVKAKTSFEIPGDVDYVLFSVTLNEEGVVQKVGMEGVAPTETNKYMGDWATGATVVLKGKKLSEVKNLDRIGQSSLSTTAFNGVLSELQKQL